MIARSFKSVAWVAAIGAAALICYMFSMRVAAERAGLAELEAQIRRTEQSIRTLQTELGTRGRVHQLQHWSAADFGFVAPKAGQFVADEVTLATFDLPVETPVMDAPVRMAAAPAPAPAAAAPKPVQAETPPPAPARPAVRQASTPAAAKLELLRRASVTRATPAPRTVTQAARPRTGTGTAAKPPAAPARTAAPAQPRSAAAPRTGGERGTGAAAR